MLNHNKLASISLAALIITPCWADGNEMSYGLGLKAWTNSINVQNQGQGGGDITTSNTVAPIVSFTARKGDYFLTFSTLMPSSYTYRTVWLKRSDKDIALGYRLNENLSLLGGYKSLTFTDGSYSDYVEKHAGFYLGAAAIKFISDKTFIYGNAAYIPKMSNSGTAQVDKLENTSLSNYEAGFGYALTNSTQITLGFRSQTAKDDNITQRRSEKMTMQGVIMGLNVNF